MKSESALIEFNDSALLIETIVQFNKRYTNSSRDVSLKQVKDNTFKITVRDDGKLLPYGIFDIATSIGSRLFYKDFKISLTNYKKRINKTIHESSEHPKEERTLLTLDTNKIDVNIKKSTGINSAISNIRPFISDSDYKSIIDFCEFRSIEGFKSENYTTKNGLGINYSIQDNYLLIFGTDLRYGKDYYRVDLEGVFEIKMPDYEI